MQTQTTEPPRAPTRFIALDIHKQYMLAVGVNKDQQEVFSAQRVEWPDFADWIRRKLTRDDALVMEMTTNTWKVYDTLVPHVHSVTVVHPPNVKLVTQTRVKTDRKAALSLAQLHAAGMLKGIWVPSPEVREMRTLVAQRAKMVRLATIAKNRLQNVLHRHHLAAPNTTLPFSPRQKEFWLGLGVSAAEKVAIACDWHTVEFATAQRETLEAALGQYAIKRPEIALLVQMPGVGLINAVTILAAIGDISRFPDAPSLVGYAGMGAAVHQSGQTHTTGRMTKAGRRDLRWAMCEAATHAVRHNPHWKREYERLGKRIGPQKAIVAIGRKLLVAVWHILTHKCADIHLTEAQVACSFFKLAYAVGARNLPDGKSALQFTRENLDRLRIGQTLERIPWGAKSHKLPPSALAVNT